MEYENFEVDLPYEERWENLTLANDFMFGKVFQDEELCLELVQIILPELNINAIAFPSLQQSVKQTWDTKGVRFDVYLHDDKGRIIVVEMQIANRDNLMKRPRAYHALMDLDAMDRERVKTYNDMPEAIVIFICDFDLFHQGRHIYTFRNYCKQNKELELDDGLTTVFLNTRGRMDDVSPRLKAFLKLLRGETSDDTFVRKLENRITFMRQNLHWRQFYMITKFERNIAIKEGREKGLQQGIYEGRQQGIYEGRQQGLCEGRQVGLHEGRQQGLYEGKLQGLEEGKLQGIHEGRQQGIKEGKQEGLAIGEAQGEAKARLEVARRLRAKGMSDIEIHALTDLSVDEINNL